MSLIGVNTYRSKRASEIKNDRVNAIVRQGIISKNALVDFILPRACISCYRRFDFPSATNISSPGTCSGNNAMIGKVCSLCLAVFRDNMHAVSYHRNCFAITAYHGAARVIINRIKEHADHDLLTALLALVVPTMCTLIQEKFLDFSGTTTSSYPTSRFSRGAYDDDFNQCRAGQLVSDSLRERHSYARIVLIPAPTRANSVQSRFRSSRRIDIAVHLAYAIAHAMPQLCSYAPIFGLLSSAKDATGLSSKQRKNNIAQNLYCRLSARQIAQRYHDSYVIFLDDIVTSGATSAGVFEALALCGVSLQETLVLCSS